MNIPNILTGFRILLVPIYLLVYFSSLDQAREISFIIIVLAGITDILDGYIARKYNMTSKLGGLLDPLADKLMLFAILISFSVSKIIPSWIIILLFIKEVIMLLGGLFLIGGDKKIVIPSNFYGKLGTVFFYLSVFSAILIKINKISTGLFIITVGINIIAFFNYLLVFLNRDRDSSNII